MFIIAPYKGRRKCKFSISKKGETGVGGYRVFQTSQWICYDYSMLATIFFGTQLSLLNYKEKVRARCDAYYTAFFNSLKNFLTIWKKEIFKLVW